MVDEMVVERDGRILVRLLRIITCSHASSHNSNDSKEPEVHSKC